MGWEQKQVDFNTSMLHDSAYCKEWAESHKERWSGCNAWISYYPPTLSLVLAETGMPGVMMCPVRFDMGYLCDGMIKRLQEHIDAGRIVPAADSRYDAAYFEFFVKRPCKYVRPVCKYFTERAPGPSGKTWAIDSRTSMPSCPDTAWLTNKNWEELRFKGFIHFPYNVGVISAHERLMAGYGYLVPSQDMLRSLWLKLPQGRVQNRLEIDWSPTGRQFPWEDNMGLMDWYSGDYPNVSTFSEHSDLERIIQNPPELQTMCDETGITEWETILKELS